MASYYEKFFIAQPVATGLTEVVTFDKGHENEYTQTFPLYKSGDLLLKWSGKKEPPQIGQQITITMNGIGPAIVKGYFAAEDYLGVMSFATQPPEWLRKQRKQRHSPTAAEWIKEGIGCEFGTEINY